MESMELEGNTLASGDALALAHHVGGFLVESFGLDASPHGTVADDWLGPDLVLAVVAVAVLFQLVDHFLRRLIIEGDLDAAVHAALPQGDTGQVVAGDPEGVGSELAFGRLGIVAGLPFLRGSGGGRRGTVDFRTRLLSGVAGRFIGGFAFGHRASLLVETARPRALSTIARNPVNVN